jgi:hypothetical protein
MLHLFDGAAGNARLQLPYCLEKDSVRNISNVPLFFSHVDSFGPRFGGTAVDDSKLFSWNAPGRPDAQQGEQRQGHQERREQGR